MDGKPWTIADGKCAIGASDITSDEVDAGNQPWPTAMTSISAGSPVKLAQYNDMLVCLSDAQETVSMVLYNLTGNKILEGKNYISLRGISSGIYIAKVQIGAAKYAQKVIIK